MRLSLRRLSGSFVSLPAAPPLLVDACGLTCSCASHPSSWPLTRLLFPSRRTSLPQIPLVALLPPCLTFFLSNWRRLLGACAGRLSPGFPTPLIALCERLHGYSTSCPVRTLPTPHPPAEIRPGAQVPRRKPPIASSPTPFRSPLRALALAILLATPHPPDPPGNQFPPVLGDSEPAPAAHFASPPLPSYFFEGAWAGCLPVFSFIFLMTWRGLSELAPAAHRLFPYTP